MLSLLILVGEDKVSTARQGGNLAGDLMGNSLERSWVANEARKDV